VKHLPISQDYWKATISYPGIVDEIKSVYDKFEPPSYEAHFQEWQAKINEEYKPVLAEVTKMAEVRRISPLFLGDLPLTFLTALRLSARSF